MNIAQEFDTIAAIATPLGTGGVGIIRISGEKSFEIAKQIFSNEIKAGRINHGWIKDNKTKIDEVIILAFKNPNSYTGEDVIEIQCHGGLNILNAILELVLKNGARMAERGEYTKRAFLNHKMDLSQAEAVCDIIHAKTQNFAIKSARNLSGTLTQKTEEIKKGIFDLLSKIVAGIDFPEDVKEPEYEYIEEEINKITSEIDKILVSAKSSNILRQGIKIAILGKPNVGKSSLFNALLQLKRAIVTEIAGTTRDVLTETLELDGIPLTLIDTAGIRETQDIDKVEEIGIEYSKQSAKEADIILFLYDSTQGLQKEDNEILEFIKDKKHIIIANKTDLAPSTNSEHLSLSTVTKEGFETLKDKIKELIGHQTIEDTEFVTNSRQQDCLTKAKNSLGQALLTTQIKEVQDLISIDLKAALIYLEELTGEVITDDILNNIFDHFCIGK
ncbi:MAG: tRNA uridine-5-carboxymethylaminomethyl(34) synthesis GTPase MnmE [bacterium]|nr:tRNA uridine-5-carboxymethylaminomethyl(34) synthesis GTPase MnmE [bacterium]